MSTFVAGLVLLVVVVAFVWALSRVAESDAREDAIDEYWRKFK